MIRRAVGEIKPVSNSYPAPLFCDVIDQVGERFIISGNCTCCDKNILMPVFMSANAAGMNIRFQHNSLLDTPLKQSKYTCLDCDQKLIEIALCVRSNHTLLE